MKKGIGFAVVALALILGGCGRKKEGATLLATDTLKVSRSDTPKVANNMLNNVSATTSVMPGLYNSPIQVSLAAGGNPVTVSIYNLDEPDNVITFQWPRGTTHTLTPTRNDEWDVYTIPAAGANAYIAYISITNNNITQLYHAPYGTNVSVPSYSFTGVYTDALFHTYAVIEVADSHVLTFP